MWRDTYREKVGGGNKNKGGTETTAWGRRETTKEI